MAAGDKIFACKGFAHGTNTLTAATHGRITPGATRKEDPLAQKSVMADKELIVEVFGNNARELYALVGATKANAVFTVLGAAGAAEKHTAKDCYFDEVIADNEIPEADSGGKLAAAGIRGHCAWGANDTFATMWAVATA